MLITSQRFYERIQLGLRHPDEQVRNNAESCMSYLTYRLREPQLVLPEQVVALLEHLPEAT